MSSEFEQWKEESRAHTKAYGSTVDNRPRFDEDAYPLQTNHIPSKYMYEIVRGENTGRVRCSEYEMIFPELPAGASFFEQQAKA